MRMVTAVARRTNQLSTGDARPCLRDRWSVTCAIVPNVNAGGGTGRVLSGRSTLAAMDSPPTHRFTGSDGDGDATVPGPAQRKQRGPRRPDLAAERAARVKVLHISGEGRSGSTLLGSLLGQQRGWFSAGEVRYLWQRGLIERRLCGCGVPVPECPVWSEMLTTTFGNADGIDAREAVRALHRLSQPSVIARALQSGTSATRSQLGALSDTLTDLYAGLREVTGCEVIVDTSKPPTYGWLLSTLPSVDLYTVHLVRDPRAVAFSWQRHKSARDRPQGGDLARKTPTASALHWTVWNLVAERLGRSRRDRYLRLRYEDLVADPVLAVRRIVALVGESASWSPPPGDDSAELGVNHAVAGNPSRFDRGRVSIELDAEWSEHLATRDRRIVALLSAPVRRRYGYHLRTGHHAGRARV